jgi:subtilisin family serine protease
LKPLPTYIWFFIFFFFLKLAFGKQPSSYIPANNHLIIQFTPGTKADNFIQAWNAGKAKQSTPFKIEYLRPLSRRLNIHLIRHSASAVDLSTLINRLRSSGAVLQLQADRTVQFRTLPNDQWLGRQWPVNKIELDKAWDLTTGGLTTQGDTIVIAILDQGFDVDHEDLFENIWNNPNEIPFDGIDNDQNGYIDDEKGWNFVGNSPDFSPNSHGSSVAGIIGARGNNSVGVAGVNWQVKLMLFQISEVSHIISAYEYIVEQRRLYHETDGREGAYIVATNASFGADDVFCTQEPLWGAMYDELGAVGILTGAGASNRGNNIDQSGDIPATCPSPFIINVLNTNEADQKEPNSSYSTTYIDMASPGENAYTTKPFDRYGLFGDNSASAPHVTGAIGLLYALACPDLIESSKRQPAQTALLIKDFLLQGVDMVPGLDQYTLTGGRLNAWKAAQELLAACDQEQEAELAWEGVYPNPARDILQLEFLLSSKVDYTIQVFSPLGQLVYAKSGVSSPVNVFQREFIGVAGWSKGAYIVQIIGGEEKIERVFIKL